MSYRLKVPEKEVFGKGKYVNDKGNCECVEFVRQATDAPGTPSWTMGTKIADAKPGEILRGTAIATFDPRKRYPVDDKGKHAAIYLQHNVARMVVLDQWKDQGEVKERSIAFNRPKGTRRSNDGDTFYVIE
jgi:hypothetical protein